MSDQETTAVTIPADCVRHIEDACGELEQLIRLLGTMKIDNDSSMAVRGLAVRMSQLHRHVFGAICGSVKPEQVIDTLRGPKHWFNEA